MGKNMKRTHMKSKDSLGELILSSYHLRLLVQIHLNCRHLNVLSHFTAPSLHYFNTERLKGLYTTFTTISKSKRA